MVPASSFQVVEVVCEACSHKTFYSAEYGVASQQVTFLLKSACRKCAHVGCTVQLKYSLPPGTMEVLDLPEP
jgi:hypothetical protein